MVDLHPEGDGIDVVVGKAGVVGELHFGLVEGDGLFLEGVDGALEELAIEVEADGGDLARLLDAEDVAGAPDLEVAHGDFHAAAVTTRFNKGVESLLGELGEADVLGDEKIGVGGAVPAAHSAAELVEVGQAVGVGAVDEDGVGIRYVDSVFDDGGGKEDVDLSLAESVEDGVDIVGVHLPVDDADAGGRDNLLDRLGAAVDRFNSVVDVKALAASGELSLQRVLDELGFALGDDGLDGEAVLRRCVDDRHVAGVDERHVESAGNGSGGKGEAVDADLELF